MPDGRSHHGSQARCKVAKTWRNEYVKARIEIMLCLQYRIFIFIDLMMWAHATCPNFHSAFSAVKESDEYVDPTQTRYCKGPASVSIRSYPCFHRAAL